ncbi:hypothetical protein GBAR_LOCUS8828, partial [Geodia barretti]
QADTDDNGLGDACEGSAVLVLEPALVKVNEDAEEAHFCFLIEDRMDGCPVPFPFQIYLSTITGTADSPGDFSAVRQQMQLFLNCSKSLCVSIPIRDDTVLELEETFEVSVELGTTAA